ncbi:calcium-translocating P-type ATPase, PMCA-type [Acetivibrio cellulolyticus]|uniref:calcium-translocating P-type ATPase, PMCA-type n=2 Tax=Acetivibrio cellulolyticus TaxID=35830 RepID=UPI0001E2F659|nr:calcium-translocating P-type ATPase, PMCA-type [Acetivibrio cellulolyticus]
MKHYFEEIEAVFKSQETSKNGIDSSKAQERLEKYGRNKLDEGKKKSVLVKFLEQLKDPMIIVLIAAAVVSGALGEIADAVIIMIVVVVNSILGVVQEGKAEKAIEALQKMSSPFTKVRRNGQVMQVKSDEIVPGDVILLEAGDSIPADMRIIEASSFKIEEASLTGESVPSEKTDLVIPANDKDIPLGDRVNMAYMGTNVVYGRGEGVVVATGMSTEMGKIANIISNAGDEKTPLQQKLSSLSKVLSVGVLGICVFIFAFGVFRGGEVFDTFLMAISLAVAAIPEGLVAVVTVVLSIGVTKMSKRNSIIRKLTAVETLGCTQVICSDKTGTLTQNKMTVVESYTLGNPEQLAISMALCNDASLTGKGDEVIGEPTESALVRYAYKEGQNKTDLVKNMPRVAEAPFDSVRKMMSTVHKEPNGKFIQYTKGAPDELLKACTHILTKDGAIPLTDAHKSAIMAENKKMANKALRVLASALKQTDSIPEKISPESLEKNLTFIGLTGMIDPIRPEVKVAIEKCRQAGIRPIMITGDHIDTAVAIAKELGIITNANQAITGAELSEIPDHEFEKKIHNYSVYARVQPEHKVRIVTAWKKQGKVTAMTGDGVNDAPALKSADIGIGMGITGTDVTKNVSDMVLADDNFASIVYAVEEGRRIYDNIRKAIQFLLSSNLSEVIALFIATVMNFKLFSPIHVLWINLITDTLPAISLGMEEAENDVMMKPPRSTKEGIFSNGLGFSVIYQGVAIAALTLISFFIGNKVSNVTGMTMAFMTMTTCEVFQALNLRSMTKSIFALKTRNKYLFGAMILSFVLSLCVIYIPGLNTIFKLTPLSGIDLFASIALAVAIIPIVELVKLITRSIKK